MKKEVEKRRLFFSTLSAPRSYDDERVSKLGAQGEEGKGEEGALSKEGCI